MWKWKPASPQLQPVPGQMLTVSIILIYTFCIKVNSLIQSIQIFPPVKFHKLNCLHASKVHLYVKLRPLTICRPIVAINP